MNKPITDAAGNSFRDQTIFEAGTKFEETDFVHRLGRQMTGGEITEEQYWICITKEVTKNSYGLFGRRVLALSLEKQMIPQEIHDNCLKVLEKFENASLEEWKNGKLNEPTAS